MFQDCNFLNGGLRLNLLPPGPFPASKFISHQFSRRGEFSPQPPPHLTLWYLWCSIHFRYFEGFRELPCLVSAWPPTDELVGEIYNIYNCEIGAFWCALGWNMLKPLCSDVIHVLHVLEVWSMCFSAQAYLGTNQPALTEPRCLWAKCPVATVERASLLQW